MRKLLLASIAASMLPLAAMAQSSSLPPVMPAGPASGPNLSTATLDPVDAKFLRVASAAGIAEVQDGQLAESKGSPAIRQIATRMVTDHTKANAQLKELALRQGVTVPTAVTDNEAAITSKLQGLSGSAFDAEYLATQQVAHEKAIALFKTESSNGSNENLKGFATATLPTLQMHLQMIEAAQK